MSGIALHQLTETGERIRQMLEQEDSDGWQQAIDDIGEAINEKIIGCGMVYRNFLAEATVYTQEAQRLATKAKSLASRAEGLREYVGSNARAWNIKEVNAGTFKGKWRKLPDVVEIDEEQKLDKAYMRHIPEDWEPDKKLLLETLQTGKKIAGAQLVTDRDKWVFV
tara:strand:+ start:8381 stop:8878 length:498 start_codon:yes stop_codon:yes gene_type:complete